MHGQRSGIRGPTAPDKTNDRAGNAAGRQHDREGSGTDQPSRMSRSIVLAPVFSVGGTASAVKCGGRNTAVIAVRLHARAIRIVFEHADTEETGVAGKHAGLSWHSIATPREESGTARNE